MRAARLNPVMRRHPTTNIRPGIEPVPVVAVVSSDQGFREALTQALIEKQLEVVSGRDHHCLAAIESWAAEWRELEVEAVVIDLGQDVAAGLDTLDAVRRRDPNAFVIVLSRVFGMLGTGRVGANLLLEGNVEPPAIIDALMRRRRHGRL